MGERLTALVVQADVAPEGAFRLWRGNVQVLATLAGQPRVLAGRFRLDAHRWLVPGMDVTVDVDPTEPDSWEVDWDAVPSIEDRAAANDPTLADPVAARRKVAQALGQLPDPPNPRFEQSLAHAAATPAPGGQVRAVVKVATIRGNMDTDDRGNSARTMTGTSAAVLSVWIPGQPPYAVYEKKFKLPRGRIEVTGAGLPALVDVGDRTKVTILWDEVPNAMAQVQQRMAHAVQQVQAAPAPPTLVPPPADPSVSPMVQGARIALAQVTDPRQRQAMIEAYRAAGIPIED